MQLHQIQKTHGAKKTKRVGRGGKRGKTSGRGMKGQKARAGRKIRPEIRDMIKKVPKLRGRGKNSQKSIQAKPHAVNLSALEAVCAPGDRVMPKFLLEKSILKRRGGKMPPVKILGNGEITKKITVSGIDVSKSAQEKIEKAGGAVS